MVQSAGPGKQGNGTDTGPPEGLAPWQGVGQQQAGNRTDNKSAGGSRAGQNGSGYACTEMERV